MAEKGPSSSEIKSPLNSMQLSLPKTRDTLYQPENIPPRVPSLQKEIEKDDDDAETKAIKDNIKSYSEAYERCISEGNQIIGKGGSISRAEAQKVTDLLSAAHGNHEKAIAQSIELNRKLGKRKLAEVDFEQNRRHTKKLEIQRLAEKCKKNIIKRFQAPITEAMEGPESAAQKSKMAFHFIMAPILEKSQKHLKSGSSRSGGKRTNFKREIAEYYGIRGKIRSGMKGENFTKYWDPILKKWYASDQMRAAHIVPLSLDKEDIAVLFEKQDASFRWNPQNGLMLHQNLEKAWDAGRFVIVPIAGTKPDTKPVEYEVRLVDPEDGKFQIGVGLSRWRDIDGTKLEFKSAARPARHYMYYKFASVVMAARRHWHLDVIKPAVIPEASIWATVGRYCSRGVFKAMAAEIGDSLVEIENSGLIEHTFDDEGQRSAGEYDFVATKVFKNMLESINQWPDETAGEVSSDSDLDADSDSDADLDSDVDSYSDADSDAGSDSNSNSDA